MTFLPLESADAAHLRELAGSTGRLRLAHDSGEHLLRLYLPVRGEDWGSSRCPSAEDAAAAGEAPR